MHRQMNVVLGFFDTVFLRVAQLALFVMMICITVDALGRYAVGIPLSGSFEFTSLYLMVIVAFLSMPATYARGGMVRLDVLTSWLEQLPGKISARLNALLSAAAFGLLTWFSAGEAIEKFIKLDTTFGAIQFPLYWSYVWVPLGCGLLTVRLFLEIFFPTRPQTHAAGDTA
ncbi:TRAP transporter small permease [Sneathiella chinensis]|uniref:TRAP transporter small permease protein n=1 Tax=Sneathiella chinensis TaxID=349750 RepID=A0ABQ5U075_9PROT|nr:TRAP transporter small permease [Sneathiella chinensis]GLQ05128.1 C4-dicarboxylate ABC transporter permease [Sneathiella chinensis]